MYCPATEKIMFMRALRLPFVVLLVLVLSDFALGREFPIRTETLRLVVVDGTLLIAYLYLMRSLVRLPIVAVITWRLARQARQQYSLHWRESLSDALLRGVYDRRRWTVGNLAVLDRTALVLLAYLTTLPGGGPALMRGLGILGGFIMIVVYLYTGKFTFIIGEEGDGQQTSLGSLPFIDLGR